MTCPNVHVSQQVRCACDLALREVQQSVAQARLMNIQCSWSESTINREQAHFQHMHWAVTPIPPAGSV